MKRGKKYIKVSKDLDRNKSYSLQEGIKEVKKTSYSKFVGSLEVHFDIVIPKDRDPKSIKGALSLPYSSDVKSVVIAAFVFHDKEKEVIAMSSITPTFNEKREATLLLTSVNGKLTLSNEN